jgi:hypothetical protein
MPRWLPKTDDEYFEFYRSKCLVTAMKPSDPPRVPSFEREPPHCPTCSCGIEEFISREKADVNAIISGASEKATTTCLCKGKLGWTRDAAGRAVCSDCRLPIKLTDEGVGTTHCNRRF